MGNLLCKPSKRHDKDMVGGPHAPGSRGPNGNEPSFTAPIPMPELDELNAMFEALLDDLNLRPDKRDMMRQFPPDRKWIICQAQLKEKKTTDNENDYEQTIEALKSSPDTELLSGLVVSLRTRPMRWIGKFIASDGLSLILSNLRSMEEGKIPHDHGELYIKCLKSLMNNKHGLSSVMSNDESLPVIALSLRSPSLRTRALAIEILAAFCMIPNCHKRVLQCMTDFAKTSGERARFETVVSCFNADMLYKGTLVGNARVSAEEKFERIIELQVASLSFINSIINAGAGKELDFRLSMRYELIQLGVDIIVDRLAHAEHDLLNTQIDIYQNRAEADEMELIKRYDVPSIASDDIGSMCALLQSTTKNTRSQPYLTSILQHLFLIPQNPVKRAKYFQVLNELVRQLVLQKDGENPDPSSAKVVMNVQSLVTDLIDADKLKDAEERAKKNAERVTKAVKDLDAQKEMFMKEMGKLEEAAKTSKTKEDSMSAELAQAKLNVARLENLLKERFLAVGAKGGEGGSGLTPEILQKLLASAGAPPADAQTVSNVAAAPPTPRGSAPPPPPPSLTGSGPPPPPPPPGPGASGPPPPPPPPGMGGGPPPPPPPGGMGAPTGGLPVKKNKLSSKALKPFQWTKLNNPEIPATIWKSIDDAPIHKKMDYSEFEEMFAAYVKKEKEVAGSKANLSGSQDLPNGESAAAKISLLDSKRSQNTNIFMRSLKLSADELHSAIYSMDFKVLTPHVITELLKLAPTPDEILMLQPYESESQNLGAPEQFIWKLSKISRYQDRVRALYVKSMYDEWSEDCKRQVKNWTAACKEIKGSKKLTELFQIVLALGNYLNSGQRGGAYGFKLDSLGKIGEVRSAVENRRHTLLHYMVELIEKKFTEVNGWQDDLKSVESACKVELPIVRQLIVAMKSGLKDVNSLLEGLKKDPRDPTDKFSDVFEEWRVQAQKKFDILDVAFKEAEVLYKDLCTMFAEDPASTTPAEFFSKFHQFIVAYLQAKTDNEQAIQKQLDAEKKEREKQEREKIALAKKLAKMESSAGMPDGQKEGELDDLISSIKTGKAFISQDFQPGKRSKNRGSLSKPMAEAIGDIITGDPAVLAPIAVEKPKVLRRPGSSAKNII